MFSEVYDCIVEFQYTYTKFKTKKSLSSTEASHVLYMSRVLLKYTYLDATNIALF